MPDAHCLLPFHRLIPRCFQLSISNFQLCSVHPDELINEHFWRAPNAFCARRIARQNAPKRSVLLAKTHNKAKQAR
jgi:hypothetical protein